MPVLKNPKHERFAQELAKGAAQYKAYSDAGYTGGETAACRLSRNVKVTARVAELQKHSARRTEITVASITNRLIGIADKAEKDEMGAPGLSVARASLMDAAKLNGLVVDTKENISRTPEERRTRIAELQAERERILRAH